MADTLTLFGIPNCDTVKKARAWLAARGIETVFHDYKKQGVPADRLAQWVDHFGWERVLNRRGTAWRQLDADVQGSVTDAASAIAVMRAHASTIKRPVVERGADRLIGFDEGEWARVLG